jgi:hypothetical protein
MRHILALPFVLLIGGCSSSSSSGHSGTPKTDTIEQPSCQGFPVVGLQYSPGGSVLPNTCMPFDSVTNNPFAIRCVDANPDYQTGFIGDESCILPPAPDHGTQVGFHPQPDGYWDRMWANDLSAYQDDAALADFLIQAGDERVQNFNTTASNTDSHYFYRIDLRMRPGSHHFTSFRTAGGGPDGWDKTDAADSIAGIAGGIFYNAIRQFSDRPATSLEVPDEAKGLGVSFGASQGLGLQVHHINTTQDPILRELWINLWWLPDSEVTREVAIGDYLAPSNIPAGAIVDSSGSFAPDVDTQILSLAGHRHAWTTRFNAWVERRDGTSEEVYDSFSWKEPPQYGYDSYTTNPVADPTKELDGASSGPLTLHAGDILRFNCHVENTLEQAMRAGAPSTLLTNLTFGNQAFGAEMCILNSELVGAPITR